MLGVERTCLSIIQAMCDKPTANRILVPEIRNKTRCLLATPTQRSMESPRQEKKKRAEMGNFKTGNTNNLHAYEKKCSSSLII